MPFEKKDVTLNNSDYSTRSKNPSRKIHPVVSKYPVFSVLFYHCTINVSAITDALTGSELYQRPQNISENDWIDTHNRRAIMRKPTRRLLYRPLLVSIQYPVNAPSRSIKLTFDDTRDRSVILPSAAGSSQSPRNVTADSIPFDAIWPLGRERSSFSGNCYCAFETATDATAPL